MSIHSSDIDECADEEKPCLMDDFCVNKLGGYSCECGPGYTSLEDKACIGDTIAPLLAIKLFIKKD